MTWRHEIHLLDAKQRRDQRIGFAIEFAKGFGAVVTISSGETVSVPSRFPDMSIYIYR